MKKLFLVLIVVALAAFLLVGCISVIPGDGESGANVYVSTVGDDNNDGSMGHPWRTIQHALNNTPDGEIIQVATGVYTENISFPSDRALVLKSKSGASSTIIDGGNIESVVEMDSCPDGTVLDGFMITGGDSYSGGGIDIINCSPIIKNNTISENTASQGGGISVFYNCSPTIKNNTISENTAACGSGIYVNSCSPTIQDNTISENIASSTGGGIYIGCFGINMYTSLPEILNNTISENTAQYGGGIYIIGCAFANIRGNTIFKNTATKGIHIHGGYGGGLYISGYPTSPTIQDNTISENTAGRDGGGIYVGEWGSAIFGGTSAGDTLNFNTVCGNSLNQIYPNSYPNNYIFTDCN